MKGLWEEEGGCQGESHWLSSQARPDEGPISKAEEGAYEV